MLATARVGRVIIIIIIIVIVAGVVVLVIISNSYFSRTFLIFSGDGDGNIFKFG